VMASLRQINANRANAQRSTGPRTDEGKAASRANALKHGLAGQGLCLPDEMAEAAAERTRQWHSSLKPMTAFDTWLVELIATEAVRVDACRVREVALLTEQAHRADESWDDDRRLAAAQLAARLTARPEVVARQLLETVQGLDLLLERWAALGAVLEQRDWT